MMKVQESINMTTSAEEPNAIVTAHNLDFKVAESPYALNSGSLLFRVGTCEGLWSSTKDSYVIISVKNDQPGNGHFTDVLQWFESSCRRDHKNLLVVECMNPRFYKHLLSKQGFRPLDPRGENCIKVFNKIAYKKLLRHGNELIIKGSLKCR